MNAAYVRIFLRYVIGAAFVGAGPIGEQLATDPDIVMIISGLAGAAVEGIYVVARNRGWSL